MSEQARFQAYTIAVILFLLFMTALGNSMWVIGIGALLLAVGLVLFPGHRGQGLVAAGVAAAVAASIAFVRVALR